MSAPLYPGRTPARRLPFAVGERIRIPAGARLVPTDPARAPSILARARRVDIQRIHPGRGRPGIDAELVPPQVQWTGRDGANLSVDINTLLVGNLPSRGPGICRVCGCMDHDCRGCVERTGEPCSWIEPDLCSACADLAPTLPAAEQRIARRQR